MTDVEKLRQKYPGASAWAFGDTPEMAVEKRTSGVF